MGYEKYLLLILFLLDSFFVFSQGIGFLGKSKLSVKKEMNAATGLATKIKSGGYECLAYQSRSSSSMFLQYSMIKEYAFGWNNYR